MGLYVPLLEFKPEALNKHPVGSNGLPRILMTAFAR